MDKLQYFVGKICTIITNKTARDYNDEQFANMFTGVIDEIDGMGIWIKMVPEFTRKAFFPVHSICGIIEEVIIPITAEEEKSIKEAYVKEQNTSTDLISIGSIRNKANQIKNQYGVKK